MDTASGSPTGASVTGNSASGSSTSESGSTGGSSSASITSNSSTSSTSSTTSVSSASLTDTSDSSASASTTGVPCDPLGGTGDSGGSQDPWLEVTHNGAPFADGATLGFVCGGQGSAMLEIQLWFGGYVPDSVVLPIDIQIDVPGFNSGFAGNFYSYVGDIYPGCIGADPYNLLQMFPPDDIWPLTLLDGAPGTISITIETPDGPAAVQTAFVIAATEADTDCF